MRKQVFILDKVFVFIFIILLFIPAARINDVEINEKENRVNSKLTGLRDFEEWISDRFYLRDVLIDLHHNILYKFAIRYPHINSRIIDKKTKFLNIYPQVPIYKEKIKDENEYKQFIKGIQSGLANFDNFCKQNSIKLYVLVLPEKESVYHPSIIINNNDDKVRNFINEINTNEVKIIFPLDELKKEANSGHYMYYKTDHHLTNEGYYIAYTELLKNIIRDFPYIKRVSLENYDKSYNIQTKMSTGYFNNGSLCSSVPEKECKKHLDVEYLYLNHKRYDDIMIKKIRSRNLFCWNFYNKQVLNTKLLIIGNSNIEDMCLFLPFSFKNVKKIRLNGPPDIPIKEQYQILKHYKQEILNYKPDIIVLCTGYDSVKEFSKLTK